MPAGDVTCELYCITLRNGLKISEYKAYWLTDFPLIARQEIIMMTFQKKQQTSIRKISNFPVNMDRSYKVSKQGWSPTPADIVVGI